MAEGKKASDLFIECLEEEGCEYIFGVPGEENLDFLDSLSRSKKIKLILTRHEQGAGFMAATYGRHTGKTGVCIATLGPGATNFVTAAAYATLGGMPMLMITGQKPIKKSKQGRFQILDVVSMMGPITKYTHQMASSDNIPSRVREAFRLAEEEKPGAVHIELPEDIADEHTDSLPLTRSIARRPSADPKAVSAAVARLEAAKAPILVIGAGANRTSTGKMLREFVEKSGIPFLTTQLGKGVSLANGGTAPVWVRVTRSGIPEADQPAASEGITVTRQWYTLDGKPLPPGPVKAGTTLVAVIGGEIAAGEYVQGLVVDLLPAGFEIENTALGPNRSPAELPWLPELSEPDHVELRDDRYVAALDLDSDTRRFTLAYLVRAVTPGEFRVPAVLAEDMYRPQVRGRGAMGRVKIE